MSRDLIESGLGWSWGPERVARSIANKDTFTLLACDRDPRCSPATATASSPLRSCISATSTPT